ncbi:MAG: hypothetical protein OEQ28_06000 [Acidobacteriota bacterium]|nr:hypothetical protein [Acidobacteriota bacterium]
MKKVLTIIFTLSISISTFAHSNEEIENELVGLMAEIEKYSSYSGEYSDERDTKLANANIAFRNRLLEHTSQHASTLAYSFPKLGEEMMIETSSDGHLRIYSWDTLSGGTMHMYDNVYQYRGLDGVRSKATFHEEGDPQSFVNVIYNIGTKTGTVYLVSSTSVLSSSYHGASIGAYQINENLLSDGVKIIQTKSGPTDSISFGYDVFTLGDREEYPVRLFKYDPKSKTISFPVVIEDDKTPQGRVTDKKIVYRYDGKYFVRVEN